MEVDFLCLVTGQRRRPLVDTDDAWIHSCYQSGFHHCPPVRVHVHVADVAAAMGSHKPCGKTRKNEADERKSRFSGFKFQISSSVRTTGLVEGRTNGTQLSQKLHPQAQDELHGGLRQEVLLAEAPLTAFTAGLLPCLQHTHPNQ